MKAILRHIIDWSELYLVVPITLLAIEAAKWFYYVQTGRNPTISEGGIDWIVSMTPRLVQIAVAITFVSLFKQATGIWMTVEQQLQRPSITIADKLLRVVVFAVILHALAN